MLLDRHALYVRAMRTINLFYGGTLTVGIKDTRVEDSIRLGICVETHNDSFGKLQGKPERVDLSSYCLLDDTKHDLMNGATLVLNRMGVFVRGHVWLNRDGSLGHADFHFEASYHTTIIEPEVAINMQYQPISVRYQWQFGITERVREHTFEVPLASIPGFSASTLVIKFNFPNMPQ